jgi:hypothetical protein
VLVVIRAARAALGSGDDEHEPRSAAQPGLVVLTCLTPVGEVDTETRSRQSNGIIWPGPWSPGASTSTSTHAGKATTCRTATTTGPTA